MKSDEQLFREYLGGDDQGALEELFGRHRDDLLRVTGRILRNEADAHDAVQAAYLQALQSLPDLKEASRFPGWIRRIAVNAALGIKRARGTERARAGAAARPEAEVPMSAQDFQVLQRALGELPEEYRLPILLHHSEGLSYEEIARILEWPKGTVGTNIHRGLERLRSALAGSFAASDGVLIALLEGPPPDPPRSPDTALACGPSTLA